MTAVQGWGKQHRYSTVRAQNAKHFAACFLVTCAQSRCLERICSSNDTRPTASHHFFSDVPTYKWQTIADNWAELTQYTTIHRNTQHHKVLKARQTEFIHNYENTQGKLMCINIANQTQIFPATAYCLVTRFDPSIGQYRASCTRT